MKTMGHSIQTRIISAALVFVMVFASIVAAGASINGDLSDFFNALGFGNSQNSSTNLAINTAKTKYDFVTDGGNWGYEITKTTGLVLDGLKDDAYTTSGITLNAKNYNGSNNGLPASGSTFTVSFAADNTNIYVFYEFTKKEAIFYDSTSTHWYDCVDFLLGLDASEKQNAEFRIWAVNEGQKTASGTTVIDAEQNLQVFRTMS